MHTVTELIQRQIAAPLDPGVHCIECGYILYKLDPTGNCPECGVPIGRSLHERLVPHATLRIIRLRRIAIALWIVALSLPTITLVHFTLQTLSLGVFWDSYSNRHSVFTRYVRASIYTWGYALEVSVLIRVVVVLLLSKARTVGDSAAARISLWIACGLVLLAGVGVGLSFFHSWNINSLPSASFQIVYSLTSVPPILADVLVLAYLAQSLDRIRCRQIRRGMWGALLIFSLLTTGALFGFYNDRNHPLFYTFFSPRRSWAADEPWTNGDILEACVAYGFVVATMMLLALLACFIRVLDASIRSASHRSSPAGDMRDYNSVPTE